MRGIPSCSIFIVWLGTGSEAVGAMLLLLFQYIVQVACVMKPGFGLPELPCPIRFDQHQFRDMEIVPNLRLAIIELGKEAGHRGLQTVLSYSHTLCD